MRPRTRLTAPPDAEPVPAPSREPQRELYVPFLDLPREPRVPSRWRRAAVTVLALALVAGAAYLGFVAATSGQAEDPSFEQPLPTAPEG